MREEAQAVIIGGGVAGCSIAYHLTLMGWRDIVLVERGQLTGGSNPRPARLIGPLAGIHNLTPEIIFHAEVYSRLRREDGIDTEFEVAGNSPLARRPLRIGE